MNGTIVTSRVSRLALTCVCAALLTLTSTACGDDTEPPANGNTNNSTIDGGTPDQGETAQLTITAPQTESFLETTTTDVTVAVESGNVSEIELRLQGVPVATTAAEEGTATFEGVDLSEWNATETPVVIAADAPAFDMVDTEPVTVVVDSRRSAVKRLAEASERDPVITWSRQGFPSYIDLEVPVSGENRVERGFGFFEEWSDLIQIENPREVLAPGRLDTNDSGLREIQFQQHVNGIPVAQSALTLTFSDGSESALAFSGHFVRDLPEFRDAELTLDDAESIAMSEALEIGASLFVTGHTRRMVYDPALWKVDADSEPTFAWRVTIQGLSLEQGSPLYHQYWIDDQTGEVLNVVEGVRDLKVKVFNAKGKRASDGASSCMSKFATRISPACFQNVFGRTDGCNSDADADGEAADARRASIDIDSWLGSNFGWDTQSNGGTIKSFVNVTFDSGPNAQSMNGWCNKQLQFSDDWMVDDVFYHEMGHRLVRTTGTDFTYQDESGALDEHAADMFGALIEGEDDGDGFDEVIGEDLPGGAIRNAMMPGNFGDPATYSNRFTGSADNGGVHINSGIPNKAMWLLAVGDEFQGYEIDPIGPEKVKTLLWKNLQTSRTSSGTNFDGWANSAVTVAQNNFTTQEACQVRNAFAAVGIIPGDSDCDGTLNNRVDDNDGDGVADGSDNCTQRFNPSQKDSDGDGTGDVCDTDVDGDGVNDDADNCPTLPNGSQTDSDGNGVGDVCEDLDGDGYDGFEDNCPNTENYLQRDADNDGVGNVCDDDDDGDGVSDSDDNCPLVPNSGQADRNDNDEGDACEDADDDGLVDANDACPDTFDYPDRDRDNDGLLDACEDPDDDNDGFDDENDNCRFVENVEQADLDGDGVGYECDNCHDLANADQRDADNDGVGDQCDDDVDGDGTANGADNCPMFANPSQRDLDGDGTGDECDSDPLPPEWAREGGLPPSGSILANIPDDIDDLDNPNTGLDIPIDICKVAICRDTGFMPEGFQVSYEFGANFAFRAAIIDGEGRVIERLDPEDLGPGETTEFGASLSFEPEAGAFYATESAERGTFQGNTYRLRVFGDPATPDSVEEAVEVSKSEGLPE